MALRGFEGDLDAPFGKLITESSLAKLAGNASFTRGVACFHAGAVVDLVQARVAIKARVLGGDAPRDR